MSKATNQLIQEQVTEARKNIGITTIFTVGVSEYDHMRRLSGPTLDLESIRRCFIENSDTSLYGEQQLIEIADPTSDELRTQVTEFAENRRARGDIVIFYFSGHGGVLAGGKFLLCTKDTRVSQSLDGGGLLSTSAVLFQDIVHTFSSVDCRPIFIIDACFSGTSALEQGFQIGQMVQNEAYSFGNSYALLCSSSAEVESKDTPDGGAFTIRLRETIEKGMGDANNRNKPILTLDDIAAPLLENLARDGYPLPRLFLGPQLPPIAIAQNTGYQPEKESFPPSYGRIVEALWNNGDSRELSIDELGNIGRGVYSNHSKLSLPPWNLLQDGQSGSHRVLTERGIQFAKGETTIPKRIIKDSETWEWVPDPTAKMIQITDLIK